MNFSIIGGDLRTVKLAEMLSKDNQVYVYGINTIWNKSEEVDTNKFDIDKGTNKIKICKDIKEAIDKSKIVLGPVPLSKDGENLNSPFCKENIKIREIIEQINDSEKTFIAGAIKENVYEIAKNIKIIDLMEQEELTVLNTIATAEGTIQVAI